MFDRKAWREDYYKRYREKLQAKRRKYYWDHREESSEKAKEYNRNNREKIRVRQQKWRTRNPEKVKEMGNKQKEKERVSGALRFRKMRELAKRRGIVCTWGRNDFLVWFKSQSGKCHYCDGVMIPGMEDRMRNFTLDRLDNNKGYEPDNIVACCNRCNMMKGSWLTAEQTMEIAAKYFRAKFGRN